MKILSDLIDSPGFDAYLGDKLGNQLFLDDPERADRLQQYSADGGDGSTHAECIEDWREYLDTCEIDDETKEAIEEEIAECEKLHKAAGTLDEIIG